MDKSKDKKKGKRKGQAKRKEEERVGDELAPFDNKFNIDGVIKLVLSTLTQRAVGCVVGEDITTDDPWIYVRKEKLEDNLELHEESSEFLPIKQIILQYPEEEMLLGFDKPIEDDRQEFFFCTKVSAKNQVEVILEKQKAEMQKRLAQSVQKYAQPWTSLGSETEVDENIIKSLRPLFEVEVDSKYPLYSEKKKFRLRLVEHAVDGYVEILPGRFPITNVYRKRVDNATQVTPPTIENEAQTNPAYPKNMFTQYNYEYDEPKLDVEKSKNLIKFIMEKAEELDDTIHVNEHINLYTDDYLRISKKIYQTSIIVNRDIISFRDVISCKDKMVSDVQLDPFTSGILAASYTFWPFNKFYSAPFERDEVNETTFGNHLVLVWCNSDSLQPKLYLHAHREVSKLRYFAQTPNVLLGGCSNGQIIIWDLTGKLESVESREILTPSEQKHRLIMRSLMSWMKDTDRINVVLPTAITNIDYSHNAPISALLCVVPNYQMTGNGKIEKLPEGKQSMQFISCGMDGKLLVWDLLTQPPNAAAAKQKKAKKLDKRPSKLLTNVSEYRELNNILMPIYKINIKNKATQALFPLTCIVIKNNNFPYKARTPETQDIYTRTHFDFATVNPNYEFTTVLELTDKLGNFFHCKFEGHDFDQGQKLNYENIYQIEGSNAPVHDGPIRTCLGNSLDDNVILTVGGRVFAIWDTRNPRRPAVWRKSQVRYCAGIWSGHQVGCLVLARADSYFETWTLLQYSKGPSRLIRMTGNTICDQFSDGRRQHVRKNTFAVTDSVGAVRIYTIPPQNRTGITEDDKILAKDLRERTLDRRLIYEKWLQSWKQRYLQSTPQTTEASEQQSQPAEQPKSAEAEVPKQEENKEQPDAKAEAKPEVEQRKKKKEVVSTEQKWKEKQEKIMYDILLEKKELNLAEIELHKVPLQKLKQEQASKQIKVEETLRKKEEIFDSAQRKVFKASTIRKKSKYDVSFPPDIRSTMKETYMELFNDMVPNTMQYVTTHQYYHDFDWTSLLSQGKQRRKSITAQYISPTHRRSQQKKDRNISFEDDEKND